MPSCQSKHATLKPVDLEKPVIVPIPKASQDKILDAYKRGYYTFGKKDNIEDKVQVRMNWRKLELYIDIFNGFWQKGTDLKEMIQQDYPELVTEKHFVNIQDNGFYLNFNFFGSYPLNLEIFDWRWNKIKETDLKFDTGNLNGRGGVIINRTAIDFDNEFLKKGAKLNFNIAYALPDPNTIGVWNPGKVKIGAETFPHFYNYFDYFTKRLQGDPGEILKDIVAKAIDDDSDLSIKEHLFKDFAHMVGDSKDDIVIVLRPDQAIGRAKVDDAVLIVYENITKDGATQAEFHPEPYTGIIDGFFLTAAADFGAGVKNYKVDMERYFPEGKTGKASDLMLRKREFGKDKLQYARTMTVDPATRTLTFTLHQYSKEDTPRFGGVKGPETWGAFKQDSANFVVTHTLSNILTGELQRTSPADISTFGLRGDYWVHAYQELLPQNTKPQPKK